MSGSGKEFQAKKDDSSENDSNQAQDSNRKSIDITQIPSVLFPMIKSGLSFKERVDAGKVARVFSLLRNTRAEELAIAFAIRSIVDDQKEVRNKRIISVRSAKGDPPSVVLTILVQQYMKANFMSPMQREIKTKIEIPIKEINERMELLKQLKKKEQASDDATATAAAAPSPAASSSVSATASSNQAGDDGEVPKLKRSQI